MRLKFSQNSSGMEVLDLIGYLTFRRKSVAGFVVAWLFFSSFSRHIHDSGLCTPFIDLETQFIPRCWTVGGQFDHSWARCYNFSSAIPRVNFKMSVESTTDTLFRSSRQRLGKQVKLAIWAKSCIQTQEQLQKVGKPGRIWRACTWHSLGWVAKIEKGFGSESRILPR